MRAVVLRAPEEMLAERGAERAELFRLAGDQMVPVGADAEGSVTSDVLGVRLGAVGGRPALTWDGGSAEV